MQKEVEKFFAEQDKSEVLDFVYDNAVCMVDKIIKTLDKIKQRATIFMSGYILVILGIYSSISTVSTMIKKLFVLRNVYIFVALVIVLLLLLLLIWFMLSAFLKFYQVLKTHKIVASSIPPKEFDKVLMNMNKREIIKLKIEALKFLEKAYDANYQQMKQQAKLLDKGMKGFKLSLIFLSLLIVVVSILYFIDNDLPSFIILISMFIFGK